MGIAGGIAGAIVSVVPVEVGGGVAALFVAAAGFVSGRFAAARFDRSVPAEDERVEPRRPELHAAELRLAVAATMFVRGAAGFVIIFVGFVLKEAGEPPWTYAVLMAAAASGEAAGVLAVRELAWRLHSLVALAIALLVGGAAMFSLAGSYDLQRALLAAVVLGIATASARLIVDILLTTQSEDPVAVTALSRFETRFQACAFIGGAIAVWLVPSWRTGSLLAAAVLVIGAANCTASAIAGRRMR